MEKKALIRIGIAALAVYALIGPFKKETKLFIAIYTAQKDWESACGNALVEYMPERFRVQEEPLPLLEWGGLKVA